MTRREFTLTALMVAAFGAVLFAAVDFSGDYGLNDDWGYSSPVRWWVEDRQLLVTHWQSMPLFTQFVAGVAWSEVFGFSQGGLRQMVLVCALITVLAVYLGARTLEAPVGLAVVAAGLPLASPIFLGLSYSFMADVPTAALIGLSLLFFARSFHAGPQAGRAYAWGVVFLLLAVLLRQTALAVAVALILAEPFARGVSLFRVFRSLLVLAAAGLAYVAFTALLGAGSGLPRLYKIKSDDLVLFFSDLLQGKFGALRQSVEALLIALAQYGVFALSLLPLLIRAVWRWSFWAVLGAAGAAGLLTVASLTVGVGVLAEPGGNILTVEGLGPRAIPGPVTPPAPWFVAGMTWIGHLGLALAVLGAWRARGWPGTPARRGGILLFGLTGLILYAPHMVAYGPLFDRYALLPALFLSVALLALLAGEVSRLRQAVTVALVGFGGLLSLSLVADFFRWQDARYDLIAEVVDTGVSPDAIDGGFEYNNLTAILAAPEAARMMSVVDPSNRPLRVTRQPAPSEEVVSVKEVSQFLGTRSAFIYAVR